MGAHLSMIRQCRLRKNKQRIMRRGHVSIVRYGVNDPVHHRSSRIGIAISR
jgi:hypothetical protein